MRRVHPGEAARFGVVPARCAERGRHDTLKWPWTVPPGAERRNGGGACFGRSSLARPVRGPPGVHGREPCRALSGELRDRSAPLPPAVDRGRRRAGARQLAPAGPAPVRRGPGGTSFSAYLREVRLRNAAELLARRPLLCSGWRGSWATASSPTSPRCSAGGFGASPAHDRDLARPRAARQTTTRGP